MPNATSDMPERVTATIEEAAQFLQVSRRQVQVYQERGLLKPVYFGKLRRFRWKELVQLEKNGSE